MSKRIYSFLIITLVTVLLTFSSCDLVPGTTNTTGNITGKIIFENSTSHDGIIVSLESKEGDLTKNVSKVIYGESKAYNSKAIDFQTITDSDGFYSFSNIPEGEYTLYASSKDSSEKAVYTSINLKKGETLSVSDLKITAIGSIEGRIVIDSSATGNIGYVVFVAGTSFMAITDDEGFFTISDIPSLRDYDLLVMRGTDVINLESVSVLEGEITSLETKYLASTSFPAIASMIWKGNLDEPPKFPNPYWADHNTIDGKSYIFDGDNWNLFIGDNLHVVTFQSNGGSRVSSQLVKMGEKVSPPSSPSRDGYSFSSWYFDSELSSQWNFSEDIVLGDTTIYAKWTANSDTPYLVEYYQQNIIGDDYSKLESIKYTGLSDSSVAALVKSYIGFSENSSILDRIPVGVITTDGKLVLKLYYDRNLYSLSFEENSGSSVLDQRDIRYNALSFAPENPIREGYTFGGWYFDNEFENSWDFINDRIIKDTTLYAKWNANNDTPYKVEHYKQEDIGDNYIKIETENLQGISDSLVSAIAKSYIGFSENKLNLNRIQNGVISVDGNLVLKLYYDWDTFDVTFEEHLGSNVDDLSNIRYGTTINKPINPTRNGYTFMGWYKEEACENLWDFSKDIIFEDTSIHAAWIAKDDIIYTVEHYIQESDGDEYIKHEVETYRGSTDTIATAVLKTYTGFNENTTSLERIPSGIILADGSLVLKLYYDWKTFSVEFDENGGSDVLNPIGKVRYGTKISIPEEPTKKGYDFGGWYCDESLETLWNFDEDIITKDTSIYAKWIAQEHTLSFNAGYGGSGTMDSITLKTNEEITLPANLFTQDSHRFGGWYISLEEWIKYGDKSKFTMGFEDVTLTAGWYEYSLRGKGPSGGYIFYDDEADGVDNIPDYRFIEAAPQGWNGTNDPIAAWGVWGGSYIGGTSSSIGSSIVNTERIVSSLSGSYAANICYSATISGFSDWVLPSVDELTLMKTVLKDSRLGGFSYNRYWSSTEQNADSAWVHDFYSTKATDFKHNSYNYSIRPVRYFK